VAPVVTVDPQDGSVSFSFDAHAARQNIDATLEELLALPGKLAAERERRAVLVLDEFQEVMDIDPGLIKLMRSVFQEQGDVAHVYLGSKRHMIERIFNDENEPFWRSAKQMELGPIAAEPFVEFAVERCAATGKKLDVELARTALRITGGHPYATQELLYFLWEERTLDRALEAVLRSEHAHFSLLWERASAAQRLVLEALAAEQPARPLSTDFQRRHGLPSVATVQTALRALSRDGVVQRRDRGSYAIAEPFLAEWISLQRA
jgi:AAA+ ATPase superfamily predicted ATPase